MYVDEEFEYRTNDVMLFMIFLPDFNTYSKNDDNASYFWKFFDTNSDL